MPTISVIVPARDAAATIEATLHALAAQDLDEEFEVIVVDDGSRDGTADLAEAAGDGVVVVRGPAAGPGPARNAGARRATGSLLAFTDADCRPRPGWLRAGREALARAELVQGVVVPDPAADRGPFDRTISVSREHGLYETANMLVRRELFERLDGFADPLAARIGKPLGEDVWFGWRARRAGARVAFSEATIVEHAVFDRRRRDYVGERLRLAYFPRMVALMPELRERFLWRRWFMSERSAAFALAAAGLTLARAARRRRRAGAALGLAACAPYARIALRDAGRWRRRAPEALAVGALADLVGFLALVAGSLRARTPVI
jgi:glycosyltransferase involved in cell wall biosynthesis